MSSYRTTPSPRVASMSTTTHDDRPSGSGLQILRLLREVDDSHAPELDRGQTHGTAWRANLAEALSRQLRFVAITGPCSLDFFLYGWTKNAIMICHGEKVWSTLAEELDEPEVFETSPLFEMSDWEVYIAQRAGQVTLPHALMGFAAARLELDHADQDDTRDDASTQQHETRDNATPQQHANQACSNTNGNNSGNSNVTLAVATNNWQNVEQFMNNSFWLHMQNRDWRGFRGCKSSIIPLRAVISCGRHLAIWRSLHVRHPRKKFPAPKALLQSEEHETNWDDEDLKAWCVPVPHYTEWADLGEPFNCISVLLDYLELQLDTTENGVRYIKISVPSWTWQGAGNLAAWNSASVRAVWLRKMWRAYLLLWRFSLAMKRGEKGNLLGFLQGPIATEESANVAGMLESELASVNGYLLHDQANNRPMYQPRDY